MTMTPDGNNDAELDELLGADPDPQLPPEARARMADALEGARVERSLDEKLDRLLGLDDVEVPAGLADRVLAVLAPSGSAPSGSAPSGMAAEREVVLQPAPRGRLRLVSRPIVGAALAAAAVLAAFVGVRKLGSGSQSAEPATSIAQMDDGVDAGDPVFRDVTEGDAMPSDELLAALPLLEDLEFLTEDLDPLEADALLLFDADELLLMELVELEDASVLESLDGTGETKPEVKKG